MSTPNKQNSARPAASSNDFRGLGIPNEELLKKLSAFNPNKYQMQNVKKDATTTGEQKNKTAVINITKSSEATGLRRPSAPETSRRKPTDFVPTQCVWWNVNKEEFQRRYTGSMDSHRIERLLNSKGRVVGITPQRKVQVVFKDADGDASFELAGDNLKPMDPPFNDKRGNKLEVGALVRLCSDQNEARERQQGFGGFNDSMAQCCGKVGYVQGCSNTSVRVLSGAMSFIWNPMLVERIEEREIQTWRTENEENTTFHAHDVIAFKLDDLAVIEAAQDGHGSWNEKLNEVVNKFGVVRKVYDRGLRAGDLKVYFGGGRSVRLNPDLCCVIVPSTLAASGTPSDSPQNETSTTTQQQNSSVALRLKPTDFVKNQRVLWNVEKDEFKSRYTGQLEDWQVDKLMVSQGRVVEIGPTRNKVHAKFDSLDHVFVVSPGCLKPLDPQFIDRNGCPLRIGTVARFCTDREEAARLQEGFGGLTSSMARCCGKVGYIQGCSASQVRFLSGNVSCMCNPRLLECVRQVQLDAWRKENEGNSNFRRHDIVGMKSANIALIRAAQEGHGGWNESLTQFTTQLGYLRKTYGSGDLKIYYGCRTLRLNRSLCCVLVPASLAADVSEEEASRSTEQTGSGSTTTAKAVMGDVTQQRFRKVEFLVGERVFWNVSLEEFQASYVGSMPQEKARSVIQSEGRVMEVKKKEGKVVVRFDGFEQNFTVSKNTVKPTDPISFSSLHLGDLVRFEVDEARLTTLQGVDFKPEMLKCCGKIGLVRGCDTDKVLVVSGSALWAWNPQLLTKIPPPELTQRSANHGGENSLKPGDFVELLADVQELARLQDGHGGWNDKMSFTAGQVGRILSVDWHGDPLVQVQTQAFIFNKLSCTKLVDVSECAPYEVNEKEEVSELPDNFQQGQKATQFIPTQSVAWNISREEFRRQYSGDLDCADIDTLMKSKGRVLVIESKRRVQVLFEGMHGLCATSTSCLRALDPPFTDTKDQKLEVGCLVKLCGDREETQRQQTYFGGSTNDMETCCGKIGFLQGYCGNAVRVLCRGKSFLWNPLLVERVNEATLNAWKQEHFDKSPIEPQDMVTFKYDDLALLEAAQDGHGGWNDSMANFVFDFGYVLKIFPSGDLKVHFGDRNFRLNPLICSVVVPADYVSPSRVTNESTMPTLSVAEVIQTDDRNSKWKREIQGIQLRLRAILEKLTSVREEEKRRYSRPGLTIARNMTEAREVEEMQERHVDSQNELRKLLHSLHMLVVELEASGKLIPGQSANSGPWQTELLQDPILSEAFDQLRRLVAEEQNNRQLPTKNLLQQVTGPGRLGVLERNKIVLEEYDSENERLISVMNDIMAHALISLATCVTVDGGQAETSPQVSDYMRFVDFNAVSQEQLSRLLTNLSTKSTGTSTGRQRRTFHNPSQPSDVDLSSDLVYSGQSLPIIQYTIQRHPCPLAVVIVNGKCHAVIKNKVKCEDPVDMLTNFLLALIE